MKLRCQACNADLAAAPRVRLEFSGFATDALNGIAFWACAKCIRLEFPDRGIELAPRIPDPVAEPELVYVDAAEEGWLATCRVHGGVAIKDTRDDAHLAAAIHINRVHVAAA